LLSGNKNLPKRRNVWDGLTKKADQPLLFQLTLQRVMDESIELNTSSFSEQLRGLSKN
jgi:hypothetical protein